mgnify:CR=1 FL=1
MNVQYMAETISKEAISAVVIQPTLLNLLLVEHNQSTGYPLRSLRHVVTSGEKLHTSTAEAFLSAPGVGARLWNMYGATEAGCTYFVLGPGEKERLAAFPEGVPAGLPQSYVDVWVMKASEEGLLSPVQCGEVGEICFGGGGEGFLARCYWHNEELTAEKFVETREFGRLYRTGDAGSWQDGQLLVRGRLDRQVKVHGVRIQPEAIEACLKRFLGGDGTAPVVGCLVVPCTQEPVELTAFLETAKGRPIEVAVVRSYLIGELGKLYVPKHIIHLRDGLPRTASGKPDIGALRQLACLQESSAGSPDTDAADSMSNPTYLPATAAILGSPCQIEVPTGKSLMWEVDLLSPLWRFCNDHKYRGEALFPGAGYLSLAAEACAVMWTGWELHTLRFLRPLPLTPARKLRVVAEIEQTTSAAAIRVVSRVTDSSEWVVHCECRGVEVSIGGIGRLAEDEATASYSVSRLYAELADAGFDYGWQFRQLRTVHLCGDAAGGVINRRRGSSFILDAADIDACFQITPLVSDLGFTGAPVGIGHVRLLRAFPAEVTALRVTAHVGAFGITFLIAAGESGDEIVCEIGGLELQAFESLPPEPLLVVERKHHASLSQSTQRVPRVIAVGEAAQPDAHLLARTLGEPGVGTWQPGCAIECVPHRSAALVVNSHLTTPGAASGLEKELGALVFDLPPAGRVWLIIIGDLGSSWLCLGRTWAAQYPALMLSTLCVDEITSQCGEVLLDAEPPPCVMNGLSWHLERPSATLSSNPRGRRFAGMRVDRELAVLSQESTPLATSVVREAQGRGLQCTLVLSGQPIPSACDAVLLCAVGPQDVTELQPLCDAAVQCVTICSMDALLPTPHSAGAGSSAQAAAIAAHRSRSSSGSSWVVFAPPLMAGRWYEPAAPAGLHRCSVDSFVKALSEAPPASAIFGLPDVLPKHWIPITTLKGSTIERGPDEIRAFLLREVAEALAVDASTVAEDSGIEDLGVTSLATLRLSQRLRRFLAREFSTFALLNNPSVSQLVQSLSAWDSPASADRRSGQHRRVLCLHGFKTSSTVLQTQMAVLIPVLRRLGLELTVPNGVHRTSGAAQGAAGLDEEESFGWFLYHGEDHAHARSDTVEQSIAFLLSIGPFEGVIGFSQGGAMAAAIANHVQARWALLFSPVFVPQHSAQCDCPTLMVFDREDEVAAAATQKLFTELPPNIGLLEHHHGHRLPPSSDTQAYGDIVRFLEVHTAPGSGDENSSGTSIT